MTPMPSGSSRTNSSSEPGRDVGFTRPTVPCALPNRVIGPLGPRGLAGEPLEQRAEAGSRFGDAQAPQGAVHDRLTARGDRHAELALQVRELPERRPAW